MNCQREQNKAAKTREHLLRWNEIRLTVSVQMVSTPLPIAHPRSCLTGLASAHGAAWLGTGWDVESARAAGGADLLRSSD